MSPQHGELKHRPAAVRIRPFRDGDAEQVRRVFTSGIINGPFCVHTSALRGSLKARNSLISYGSFLTGASLIAFSQSSKFRQLGRVVAALSVALFWVHRWRLSVAYRSITGYISDLEDIGRHYGVVTVRTGQVDSHENGNEGESSVITGKSGFWVAEAVDSAGEPTGRIVGCTGLDAYSSGDPSIAELRKVSVDASAHRMGVGRRLIQAALQHTLEQKCFTHVQLLTSGYQQSARGLYEYFGWKVVKWNTFKGEEWIDWHEVMYMLDLQEYAKNMKG